MMQEEDPRIKELQQHAWSLQTASNKPGKPLPEAFKRECYKVASRALSLCADAIYMDENDFLERTKGLNEEITAQKLKVKDVEEAELQKRVGKCYRATTGGGYEVRNVTAKATKEAASKALGNAVNAGATLSTTASANSASLTAAEIVARCSEDPEMLWLVSRGLGDANMEAICEGLRRGGAQLTALDLSHNSLADVGVQRLVTALASGVCPKLKDLWIGGNSFGELGREMLVSGLGALRRGLLVHTDIDDNAEGHAGGSSASSDAVCQAGKATADQRDDSGVASEMVEASGVDASAMQPVESPSATQSQARHEAPRGSASGVPNAAEAEATSLTQDEASCGGPPHDQDRLAIDLVPGPAGSQVRAVIALPDSVSSAQDLELDVSVSRFIVRLRDGSLLADAVLPSAVDPDSAQAVFSRRRRTMTVLLDVP